MRRFLRFRIDPNCGGRASAAPPFRIWRNRFFVVFCIAVIIADGVVFAAALRMSAFYRSLHERGRTAVAEITREEMRPAIRASDNRYYSYTYQSAEGTIHENSTSMHSLTVGDTVTVTYLPESPEDHVLFEMPTSRIHQPLRAAGTFVACSLSATLGFGALVQWALRRSSA